jgi:hypothetical protein
MSSESRWESSSGEVVWVWSRGRWGCLWEVVTR